MPGPGGLNWSDAFPVFYQEASAGTGLHSFAAFEAMLRRQHAPDDSAWVRLDAEARQFVVFAYSFF